MINAPLPIKSQSESHLRDIFSKLMDVPSLVKEQNCILKASWLDTPLGPMIAISDDKSLHFLDFLDGRRLEREIKRLKQKRVSMIIPGRTHAIHSIETELQLYFSGKLQQFTTPLFLLGSVFQKNVWAELKKIPYGETRSYLGIAKAIHHPLAFRAVARANSLNPVAIVIPCHRVINHNGHLGGYAGGLHRKEWLIHHEVNYPKTNVLPMR